jgi:nitrite reductase (NADH) small subunit
MTLVADTDFTAVCQAARLTVNRGVAALVDGRAVAVFVLADGSLAAIDNIDPCSGASVLSRGIVGEVDGAATVASPMYKQRFDLRSGSCLDAPGVAVAVHRVRIVGGMIEVSLIRDPSKPARS